MKEKARKELKDSSLAEYDDEIGNHTNARSHEMNVKPIPDHCADIPMLVKHGLKLKRKSRHLKKLLKNENIDMEQNISHEEDKERHKKILIAAEQEGFSKDKDKCMKSVPSVIVLHKYKKDLFDLQTEPYAEEINPHKKPSHRLDKNRRKVKNEHKSNCQEHILSNSRSFCDLNTRSRMEVEGKSGTNYKEQLKDKIKKNHEKSAIYKTHSTSFDSKLRKKKKKFDRQQILKEVVKTLNASEDIYDKIKTLPVKIDENQLIFMHPSHIAKALEHCKDKIINNHETENTDITCNELNESISSNINKKVENLNTSLIKLALDNRASSKKLRGLSSLKKMRKSIPIGLEEKSDDSLLKVEKHKKEHKRRKKLKSTEKRKSLEDVQNTEKESRGSKKIKIKNDLLQSENYTKQRSSILRQNMGLGDNEIDTSNVQNDREFTTLSSSLKLNPKFNKVGHDLKNCPLTQKNKNFIDKEKKLRKYNRKELEKLRKIIYKNTDDSEDQAKSASGDERKLTFQLIKTNVNSKKLRILRKNLHSVSDRCTLIGSKEKIGPDPQNDKLYITKRMLFCSTNKETSNTSKESLNIAIRRDTEISNNGSSNNVLNVVIKQKKNSATNTKLVNSPKLCLENLCCKHCDTQSPEKTCSENNLEKMCNDEQKRTDKNKCSKEAECQTEENSVSTRSKEGNGEQVPPESIGLGNNAIQDGLRNFLIYHFHNMNPAFKKSNAINNSHDEEMLNTKEIFQSGPERMDVCDDSGDYPNFLKKNIKSLMLENQYNSSDLTGIVHNLNTTSSTKNNSMLKQFYRVLKNDESGLNKTNFDLKCCVSKMNMYNDNKNGSDDNKRFMKTNLRIIESHCPKTESENIAEKLKNIGLSDKKSFVKVINSNYKLETSINANVDSYDTLLPFKSIKSPQKQKSFLSKQFKKYIKDDFQKETSKRQNQFFSSKNKKCPTERPKIGKVSNLLPIQQIENDYLKSTKENCFLRNNNVMTDTYKKINLNNLCNLEKTITDDFHITIRDGIAQNKQSFVHVVSANEDMETMNNMKNKIRAIPQNKFELTKKTSCCIMRNFAVSEIGVQTETCNLLPTIPYKNTSCLRDNANLNCINEVNSEEVAFFHDKPQLCNRNKFHDLVYSKNVSVPLQEKSSFVHILNNKFDADRQLNTNKIVIEQQPKVKDPSYFPVSKGEQQIGILKSCDEEKQIIYKINAVYEFLQYLDKVLKDNTFLKQNVNVQNTQTIGHFNSTLRCLCNNCIDILSKIEVKESMNGNKILDKIKSDKNLIIQSENKKPHFLPTIGEPTRSDPSQNVDDLLDVQYVSLSYGKNDTNDTTSNNGQKNPFFVILSADDKSHQQDGFKCWKDIESNQYRKVEKTKFGPAKNKTWFDVEERQDEALLKQKINNCVNLINTETSGNNKTVETNSPRKELFNNKISEGGINTFYKYTIPTHNLQRHMISQDKSGKFLHIDPPPEKSFEHKSYTNNEKNNNNSFLLKTSNSQISCLKKVASKSKLDSYCYKNTGKCLSKQQDCTLGSNIHLKKTTKSCLCPIENENLTSKLGSYGFIKNTCDNNFIEVSKCGEEMKCFQNQKDIKYASGKDSLLPTIQSKAPVNDDELCKNCSIAKTKCFCSQNNKPSNKKLWLDRVKSSFKISFKKDDKPAKTKFFHCIDLSDGKAISTDKTMPLKEKNKTEAKINFETQPKCTMFSKTQQHNSNPSSPNFTILRKKDNSNLKTRDSKLILNQHCLERKKTNSEALEDMKQKQMHTLNNRLGANVHSSNVLTPPGSIVINRNLQNETITKTINTSVEYPSNSYEGNNSNEGNVEDRDLDSDGWVPLNADITEIENDQIYLGMDLKDMTVRHVEYLQTFPENLSHCGKLGEK